MALNNVPDANNTIGQDLIDMGENFSLLEDSQIVEHNLDVTDPSNGYYVRWENGLQVCFYQLELIFDSGNRLREFWNYPSSFTEVIGIFALGYGDIKNNSSMRPEQVSYIRTDAGITSGTAFNLHKIDSAPDFVSGDTYKIFVFAIGRWK